MEMSKLNELRKLARMTGERANVIAKAKNSHIVYANEHGMIVREYPNGNQVVQNEFPKK